MTYQTYFDYLDNLQVSGTINMWGAGTYLMQAFSLSEKDANNIVAKWMKWKEKNV